MNPKPYKDTLEKGAELISRKLKFVQFLLFETNQSFLMGLFLHEINIDTYCTNLINKIWSFVYTNFFPNIQKFVCFFVPTDIAYYDPQTFNLF